MRLIFWKICIFCIFFTPAILIEAGEDVSEYSLQEDHPFYGVLENIFISSKILDAKENLIDAGFVIIQVREPMFVIASHPLLPGYLVKVHLHSSSRSIEDRRKNLICRCKTAKSLRSLILEKNLRHFVVPDKWVYTMATEEKDFVLIVTHMNIVSKSESRYAWKHASEDQLQELYCIIRHDFGSCKLVENIPFTREGVFACIDTEKPSSGDRFMKGNLSTKGRLYWDFLVKINE